MPKVSKSHVDSRRRQIIDAAIECFSKEGFHMATMDDIVRSSGLSPGAIYLYFSSKDDIIQAIADERHAREREMIASAQEQGEPSDVLSRLAGTFFQSLAGLTERRNRRLGVQLWAEALRNRRLLKIVRKGVDVPRQMLAQLVSRAEQAGDFPSELEPDAVARVMIALFQGFLLQQAWDENVRIEPYVNVIQAAFNAMMDQARQRPQR
jgi:AcrR family transcriptional regulator